MTETELRNKVCNQAWAWLGRKESDGTHREIIDLYNKHRLPGSYFMQYSDPWCAAFVSAVGMACGLPEVILPHVNCDGMIAAYKAKGQWIENDAYVPKLGDLIFYDWQDSGVGDNTGSSDHVGLVVAVSEHYMTVIEGNKSDAVGTRALAVNSRFIRGFAVPDYVGVAGEDSSPAAQNDSGAAVLMDKPEGAVSAAETQQGTGSLGEPSVFNLNTSLIPLPTLRKGAKSETVRAAQLLLIGNGYLCGSWGADGEFGNGTYRAVCSFQKGSRLETDGVIGPLTWSALLGV